MANIVNIALRGLQFFFAIVILGLSGHLVASQTFGGAPSITNYEVFLGIWLFVISVIGLAGSFISALSGVVMVALDALSVLFTFAGGVGMAAKLGVHDCSCNKPDSSCPYLTNNVVINGGKNHEGSVDQYLNRVQRCREAQADTAFVWFAFATFLGTFVLSFLSWKRGGVK
ncbi:hypothetical protein ACLMJK_001904 [Lecanora helva]